MRRLLLLPALLLVLTLPASAHAKLFGKGLFGCPTVKNADGTPVIRQDDSIVAPGVPGGADHIHTFSGNKYAAVDASRMTPSNMSQAGTTCFNEIDQSGIWVPTMQKDGVDYAAGVTYYVAANGADPSGIANGKVQIYPPGFKAIFHKGDPGVGGRWRCGNSPTNVTTNPPTEASCPVTPTNPGTVVAEIDSPNICWDGLTLDSPDHRSHFRNNLTGGVCPPDFYIRLPQQQIAFSYPRAAIGGRLSSDHDPTKPAGYSLHYDYIALWEQSGAAQFARCLNDPLRDTPTSPTCGTFTYDGALGTSPGPNPWETALDKWSAAIGYVGTDGVARGGPPAGTP